MFRQNLFCKEVLCYIDPIDLFIIGFVFTQMHTKTKNGSAGARTQDPRINLPLWLSPPFQFDGLDFAFTICFWHLGAARQVSTPSRFRAWLGVGILQRSPNLGGSAPEVSLWALLLKSDALPTELRFPRKAISRHNPHSG